MTEELKKLCQKVEKVCQGCDTHSDDCLIKKMLDSIDASIKEGTHIIAKPEFKDLLADIKKYDAKGLDLLERDVNALCMRCPTHNINCTVNRCRKCLSMILYGDIYPFRDETAEDIKRMLGKDAGSEIDITPSATETSDSVSNNKEDSSGDTEAVKIASFILREAVRLGASDIHLEPGESQLACRYRIDGILKSQPPARATMVPKVISRMKILAGIDISQKRIPQDGRFTVSFQNRSIDIRVSTFPAIYGEKVVMRLIDKNRSVITLEKLGMSQRATEIFNKTINLTNGIILITGPTGSGKSATIFAGLKAISRPDINIVTLEDPVEQTLPGITQGQVNPKAGFTFASGLRSILRQDPDVIAVGEIRDRETAEISMQAAMTGHLVFSTLHTNSAAASFMRLFDMKVEPFLVAASVRLIIAQRLVRVLCASCREEYLIDKETLEHMGIQRIAPGSRFYRPRGCRECTGLGYKGRIGIFELLRVDEELRDMVAKEKSSDDIQARAAEKGMRLIIEDGIEKAKEGITSLEEVLRVCAG